MSGTSRAGDAQRPHGSPPGPISRFSPADRPNRVAVPSIYPEHNRTAWILARRPRRGAADPGRPQGFFLEHELSSSGELVQSATILLTNRECPWHCLMCDLWKHTLTRSVPPGAIPAQIEYALNQLNGRPRQVKLYNSGSFFDPAAIPPGDYRAIAEKTSSFGDVIVEAHPRLVGPRALQFRDLLCGSLEVAMGLETVHPQVLPRLNKNFTLDHFAAAVAFLRKERIRVRAFILVKPPFLTEPEAVEWAVKSARFAFDCGAGVVSLIPTRPGNGALDQLMAAGEFTPPSIRTLEQSLADCLRLRAGRVFGDTWDLQRFFVCPACDALREGRIARMNRTQIVGPPIVCQAGCEHSGPTAKFA